MIGWGAEGNHGGDQGETHDAADDKKAGRAAPRAPRGGLPPGVVREVTTEGGAHQATQLPVEGGKQAVVHRR